MFEALVGSPRWVDALAVFAVGALAGVIFASTTVGQLAFLDQWTNTAEAFGQTLDADVYRRIDELSRRAPLVAGASGVLMALAAVGGVALALHGVFSMWLGTRRPYIAALAVAAHAGAILGFRQIVAAPLRYARESMASPTTLGIFFPMLDEGSLGARLLWTIDVFVLWWLVVLAIGTSVLYARPVRSLIVVYLLLYAGLALAVAGVMVSFGGTA
jgi:hypothetical protein